MGISIVFILIAPVAIDTYGRLRMDLQNPEDFYKQRISYKRWITMTPNKRIVEENDIDEEQLEETKEFIRDGRRRRNP